MPGIMGQPYPMEFLMTPGQVTIVIEAYNQIRHIYTDQPPAAAGSRSDFLRHIRGALGRRHAGGRDGRICAGPARDHLPYSDKMKIVERFRLMAPDTMIIETTIIDPEALTTPYSMPPRTLARHRSWTIAEYICEENNRNFVDEKGNAGTNLANPNASAR
jgi:hypothetical protein